MSSGNLERANLERDNLEKDNLESGNLESVNLKSRNLSDSAAALPTQHLTDQPNDALDGLAQKAADGFASQNNDSLKAPASRCVTCGAPSNTSHVKLTTNAKTPVMPLGITPEQVDQVIQSIVDLVGERKPTPAMVIRIVAQCLRCTKKMKLTPSLEKKLIIHTIQSYICRVDGLTQDDIDLLMVAVDTTVDEAVDTLTQFKAGKKCCVIA